MTQRSQSTGCPARLCSGDFRHYCGGGEPRVDGNRAPVLPVFPVLLQGALPMNRKLAYSLVGAGALLLLGTASNAQAFELLGRMFNSNAAYSYDNVGCTDGGAEAGCGMAADCGCETSCAPVCRPRHRWFSCLKLKHRCWRARRCCAPVACEPACEAACEPACEASCEPACEPCCAPRRHCCGWLKGLFRHHRRGGCCEAEAVGCGCEAPVADCGCGA